MQIQKVQSSNPSFGYNPTVNAKLMHKLSSTKKNKAYCDYLKSLCFATNQTELKLRDAEKRNMPELQDRLTRIFLPIKVILTDLIDTYYPKLEYKRKELETYADEVVTRNLDEDSQNDLRVKGDLGVYKGALYENIISESTILPKMAKKAEETVPAGRPVFVSPFAPLGLKKVGEILDKII